MTNGQQSAFNEFKRFLDADTNVYILRGYAGTGKTTLIRHFIDELKRQKRSYVLLASTGRAAKILSNMTGCSASTVHGLIYKFTDINQDMESMDKDSTESLVDKIGQLLLNFDLCPLDDDGERDKVYLVDEASMISDVKDANQQSMFGSGKLLSDLLTYNPNGKYVFIGDACQLPPVGQPESPALSVNYFLNTFGIDAMNTELTDIVRQKADNDIVQSAQLMRHLYFSPQPWKWAKFPLKGFRNIHLLSSPAELYSEYLRSVKTDGFNNATLIGYSNKQCNSVTNFVRPALGISSKTLAAGDLLLITQNNYLSGLMNGDLVVVQDVRGTERRAGMSFLMVQVKELFTGKVYSQLLLEDILYSNITNLTAEQQKNLYVDFYYRMKDKGIKQKSAKFRQMMMQDPYLCAIRAVFGYALTCHKAQGGEWDKVFLDIPKNLPQAEKPGVYQWIYTAMTRASKELYIVKDFWVI